MREINKQRLELGFPLLGDIISCNNKEKSMAKILDNLSSNNNLLTEDFLLKNGFERFDDEDDGEKYCYYVKMYNDIELITNDLEELNDDYRVYIFGFNNPICKTEGDYLMLDSLLKKYKE